VGVKNICEHPSLTYSQAWFDPLTKKVGGPLTNGPGIGATDDYIYLCVSTAEPN
jgi:hypothetical protein